MCECVYLCCRSTYEDEEAEEEDGQHTATSLTGEEKIAPIEEKAPASKKNVGEEEEGKGDERKKER